MGRGLEGHGHCPQDRKRERGQGNAGGEKKDLMQLLLLSYMVKKAERTVGDMTAIPSGRVQA